TWVRHSQHVTRIWCKDQGIGLLKCRMGDDAENMEIVPGGIMDDSGGEIVFDIEEPPESARVMRAAFGCTSSLPCVGVWV
ncbi:unnamed protein product, partial [Polarella glacialis]